MLKKKKKYPRRRGFDRNQSISSIRLYKAARESRNVVLLWTAFEQNAIRKRSLDRPGTRREDSVINDVIAFGGGPYFWQRNEMARESGVSRDGLGGRINRNNNTIIRMYH